MAKKEETISLIDTFSEFKELKNIDRTTMVSVLEESFRSVIAKMFGTDENYGSLRSKKYPDRLDKSSPSGYTKNRNRTPR